MPNLSVDAFKQMPIFIQQQLTTWQGTPIVQPTDSYDASKALLQTASKHKSEGLKETSTSVSS